MPYEPSTVPAQYDPTFYRRELQKLRESMNGAQAFAYLWPQAVAPTKPREGMVVMADGTHWNPGAGVGYYGFQGGAWVPLGGALRHGQCQFRYVSATECRLFRHSGNGLMVGDRIYPIPAAGAPLGTAGLTAGATYYVFARANADGSLALEAVRTTQASHAVDSITGVEVRAGDRTKSLVGMVHLSGAGQFLDDPGNRLVASWYNPRATAGNGSTATAQTGSQTYILSGWSVRMLAWKGAAVAARMCGMATNSVANTPSYAVIAVNGSPVGAIAPFAQPAAAGQYLAMAQNYTFTPADDGVATGQMAMRVGGGTGAFLLNLDMEACL